MWVTGTHFNYYHLCKRKLWLFANGIHMEHTSDLVYEGKLIHETSYSQRPGRYEELEIRGIKIDYYDAGHRVVHEIKKSDKMEEAHVWQLKYYLYVLEQEGIENVSGILEYPALRKKADFSLSDSDREYIGECLGHIRYIMDSGSCPSIERKKPCRNCSYFEFCYITEEGA